MAKTKGINVKKQIQDGAQLLISKVGVNDFSLRDIANVCNISKGTLYYYYSTKDAIILDIIENHINELKNDYLDWLIRHKDDLTKERFLSVIFYKGVKLFDRAKMHIFLINECLKKNDNIKSKFNILWSDWEKTLEIGVKNVFSDVKDSKTLAYLLMLIIDGLVIREVMQKDNNNNQEELINMIKKLGGSDE